jgi:DNA-binding NarL/FixJ family response regulator
LSLQKLLLMSDIRIALVEDHDVVRIGLRTVLQSQAGIKVVGEATNGLQGLALLQTTPIDLALIGVQIKKDGHATSAIVIPEAMTGERSTSIPEIKIL